MNNRNGDLKAIFLSPDGNVYPDTLICSGVIPPELGGKPCPYSQTGRMPDVIPLDPAASNYTLDKGQPGDLCPPCAKQQLANLQHWQGHGRQQFPEELLPLRLFKCRQWFWLVVPGLRDAQPTTLSHNGNGSKATA
jgi:hypothetical protein